MTGRPAFLLLALAAAACAQREAPAPVPLATAPTVGQEVGAVAQNKLEIAFKPGSAQLQPDAARQLDVAARLFRDVNPVKMFSVGHSDGVGDEWSNVMLSAQRARVVKQALVARGIPPDRLSVQALGQSDPANRTDPQSPENRRVVVQWQVF